MEFGVKDPITVSQKIIKY